MKITVVGTGGWGTALALLLHGNQHALARARLLRQLIHIGDLRIQIADRAVERETAQHQGAFGLDARAARVVAEHGRVEPGRVRRRERQADAVVFRPEACQEQCPLVADAPLQAPLVASGSRLVRKGEGGGPTERPRCKASRLVAALDLGVDRHVRAQLVREVGIGSEGIEVPGARHGDPGKAREQRRRVLLVVGVAQARTASQPLTEVVAGVGEGGVAGGLLRQAEEVVRAAHAEGQEVERGRIVTAIFVEVVQAAHEIEAVVLAVLLPLDRDLLGSAGLGEGRQIERAVIIVQARRVAGAATAADQLAGQRLVDLELRVAGQPVTHGRFGVCTRPPRAVKGQLFRKILDHRGYAWSRDELLGKPIATLFLPERFQPAVQLRERCRKGEEVRNWEGMRKTKSGRIIPSLLTAFPLMDEAGKIAFVATICKDISARKEMETKLQEAHRHLRELSRKSLEALEVDRRTVARELHDSIGGSLAAIKVGLEDVAEQPLRDPVCGAGQLETLISHLADAIKETKRISASLRPLSIDDLGLLATIEWYTRQFCQPYENIQVICQIGVEEQEIPEEFKIVFYRVMQEALTNAAKHSRADTIIIRLTKEASLVLRALGWPADRRRDRPRRVLDWVGLTHRARDWPSMLSGGEQQRVAIARALAPEPRLLLADEPAGNLDADRSREVLDLLREIHSRGTTVVLATHDPGLIERARVRVLRLRGGHLEPA